MQANSRKKANKPTNTEQHLKLIQAGSYDEVIKLVKKGEIQLSQPFNVGAYKNCTIWHLLANPTNKEAYRLLEALLAKYLKNAVDLNSFEANGFTPIHLAAFAGRIDVIELFMNYGGKIELLSFEGDSPLMLIELSRDVKKIEEMKALLNRYHLEKDNTLEYSSAADKVKNRYIHKFTNQVEAQNAMLDKNKPIPYAGSKEAFGQSIKSTLNNFISSFGCFFTYNVNSNKINDESEQKVRLVTNRIPQPNN